MADAVFFRRSLALIAIMMLACQPADRPASSTEPWSLEDVRVNADDGIRVLVLHDMEGLSGQDDPNSFRFSKPEYSQGQEMLVGDVNAVIDGLFAGGATEVQVVDGHGSGNPEPDVRSDLLDPRATQVFRPESFDSYFDLVEAGAYDAVAVVGMHAKTGSVGFASHTYTLGIDILLNGQAITETELVALSWGRVGIPVIFASGDDKLGRDLETMPWIEYVTVKEATSASTAIPRPVDEARADLTAAAQRAVENLASAKVMRISTPIAATLHTVPPARIDMLEGVPGIDYTDNRVTFVTDDLREAYDGLVNLIGVATTGYNDVLMEHLGGDPAAAAALGTFSDALFARWVDYESGRWQPSETPETTAGRRYHGYR